MKAIALALKFTVSLVVAAGLQEAGRRPGFTPFYAAKRTAPGWIWRWCNRW
jgi:hypothetical protein